MIIVLKPNSQRAQVTELLNWLDASGYEALLVPGDNNASLVSVDPDPKAMDLDLIHTFRIVDRLEDAKMDHIKTTRVHHPEDTVIGFFNTKIGGDNFCVIAGPSSIESKEQLNIIAPAIKQSGAGLLRGSTFQPGESDGEYLGLKEEGIRLLVEAREQFEIPVVTEILSVDHLRYYEDVDLIQVGARSMDNYELLKELGLCGKPILLKRGIHSTINDLLESAEFLMSRGNDQIILCERGVEAFETYTKNTLDLAAVPLLKKTTHLPVIVDPSHGTGLSGLVKPMSMAATAAGADGLMLEVHHKSDIALATGEESINVSAFDNIITAVAMIQPFAYKP